MAEARYLLKPGDAGYGAVCPECAAPKHRQSARCKDCYYDARRRHEYPPPPVPRRTRQGPSERRPRTYAAQPQSHPWRRYWLTGEQSAGWAASRRANAVAGAGEPAVTSTARSFA